jgi:hypothetical protein
MRTERLWWCMPAIVLCAADGLLTLWGQPAAYWTDGFAHVDEGNPVAAWFLTLHPLAFAAAGVPYLLLVIGLVTWLPRRWAAGVAMGVASAHAFAVIVWCWYLFSAPALPKDPFPTSPPSTVRRARLEEDACSR